MESKHNVQNLQKTEKNRRLKTAGPFLFHGIAGTSPVPSVEIRLARKNGTDQYFVLKILKNLDDNSVQGTQGKSLLQAEYTILNILSDDEGVIKQLGLYKDVAEDAHGQQFSRVILVLDCYVKHDYSPEYLTITDLQHYVVARKRIPEMEALNIFYKILLIVQRLHKRNIVHHDLKLGNVVLNQVTGEIKLVNFCLAKQLTHDGELLTDQRGSPAYVSPELINANPHCGKPSDMWALGVIFYTMLYGQFPFYAARPQTLFDLIKRAEFEIPYFDAVSDHSLLWIRSLLRLDPTQRMTCDEAVKEITSYFDSIKFESLKNNSVPQPQVLPQGTGYSWSRGSTADIDIGNAMNELHIT